MGCSGSKEQTRMMSNQKLVLYLSTKPDYSPRQTAFIAKAIAGAESKGHQVDVKTEGDLEAKSSRACLVPFVHVPSVDLVLFNDDALLQYIL